MEIWVKKFISKNAMLNPLGKRILISSILSVNKGKINSNMYIATVMFKTVSLTGV